ncbi:AAA family ATPase [Streptosporangium sp. NBC_01755]|uniref:AAA family ATPase n=1 Tax=unclassified Streptosporangium TaxID=2632669 RepID=UPI002DD9094D|nr:MULTISPECIES: AAA family ATPase [unclassified Streptosporangium]WSA29201.1 AAA family ATPase [Streptosporangium sp. NBC_01810]WSC99354.1 AAA family ATPase [Streptosporangium sp. NBC_01755]
MRTAVTEQIDMAGSAMGQAIPFLRRVRVKNYRSIASCDVSFTPLLVLLGPNAAGKSNFLDALRFVVDALETTPTDAVMKRGGLDEVSRRVQRDTEAFGIFLEFVIQADEEPLSVTYGFTINRDPTGRRSLLVVGEQCTVRGTQPRSSFEEASFFMTHGLFNQTGDGGIEPDRLYLPLAATQGIFSEVYRRLRSMLFYHLDVGLMRRVQPRFAGTALDDAGGRLGSVLGTLAHRYPVFKKRIDDYMCAIVPGAVGVDERVLDTYSTVELRTRHGDQELAFGPEAMSEGTLRAAGLLTALFQPAVLGGDVSLIGIEEPETSLHPAAAGALFDALSEASERVQLVVTTQSADLLDRDDFDPASVRVVTMADGLTTISEIDEVSRRIIDDGHATLGELMRSSQLRPKETE